MRRRGRDGRYTYTCTVRRPEKAGQIVEVKSSLSKKVCNENISNLNVKYNQYLTNFHQITFMLIIYLGIWKFTSARRSTASSSFQNTSLFSLQQPTVPTWYIQVNAYLINVKRTLRYNWLMKKFHLNNIFFQFQRSLSSKMSWIIVAGNIYDWVISRRCLGATSSFFERL